MTGEGHARYDYAWKTSGWTVQNPTVPDNVDSYVDPGMPDDVSTVRLYGSFLEMDTGRGVEGVLRLRVDKILTHVPTGRQVMSGPLRPVRFRASGFSIHLPATDDPQLTPEFLYRARLTVRGVSREFEFGLPAENAEVNITSLIPVS